MRKFFLIYISLCAICVQAQNRITGYRYWFNGDIATLVTANVNSQTEMQLDAIVNTDDLAQGINKFTIQFLDSESKYSVPITSFFLKLPVSSSEKSLITGYRYWMNNDTVATFVNITPVAEANITAQINLENAVNEVHIFRFQTIDNKNLWSAPITAFIFKRQNLKMQKYQYWFNNNIEEAVTTEAGNDRNFFLTLPIDTAQLNDGMNMLNVRFADDLNIWSSTLTQFFYKIKVAAGETNHVKSVEYWFDNDIAEAVKTNLQPNSDILWLGSLNTDAVSAGLHRINIRFTDERSLQSQVLSAFFMKPTNEKYDNLVIDKMRYLMGNNFSLMVMHALQEATAAVSYNNDIDLTNFRGLHAPLLVQFGDTRGLWSVPAADSVLVPVNVGVEPVPVFPGEGVLRIFPNPNKGEFTVSINNEITNGILTVSDIAGRVCYMQTGAVKSETKLKLLNFGNGVYFVTLKDIQNNSISGLSKMIIVY